MDIFVDENTNRIINSIKLEDNMSILDVGCGMGELSFQLSKKIGGNGKILGIDVDDDTLVIAQENAKKKSTKNVSFMKVDLNSIKLGEDKFDVIIGRRVLMYLKNPQKTVSALSKLLNKDGIMIFQEHSSINKNNCENALFPLHNKVDGWIWNTVKAEGGNIHMSDDLCNIFNNNELILDKLICESVIQTPNNPLPLTKIIRAMEKRIVNNKIATNAEMDIETLDERLKNERESANTIYIRENVFLIWASLRK